MTRALVQVGLVITLCNCLRIHMQSLCCFDWFFVLLVAGLTVVFGAGLCYALTNSKLW